MWDKIPNDKIIQKTKKALNENGVNVIVVKNGQEAKRKILELIPKGSEVMTMTSVTLDTIGVAQEINESGNFNSVRNKLMSMDRTTRIPKNPNLF